MESQCTTLSGVVAPHDASETAIELAHAIRCTCAPQTVISRSTAVLKF
jgi:hypothetical protein